MIANWSVERYSNHDFEPLNQPAGHSVTLDQLPRSNLQLNLLTLAIRHAEIHLLGTSFTSECQAWQDLVHDIAKRIRHELHDIPKWRGVFTD